MPIGLVHAVSGLVMAMAVTASAVVPAGPVAAAGPQDITDGGFTFSGDSEDYISWGESYAYTAGRVTTFQVTPEYGSSGGLYFFVLGTSEAYHPPQGTATWDSWSLNLAPPTNQQRLEVGTYANATRWPYQTETQPSISLSGNGRGCGEISGSFTVHEIGFNSDGSLAKINLTFEQFCGSSGKGSRGRMLVNIPNVPPRLAVGSSPATRVDYRTEVRRVPSGTRNILLETARGTVTCSQPAQITVSGTLRQTINGVDFNRSFDTAVGCAPGSTVPWSATVSITLGPTAITLGSATLSTKASAFDTYYLYSPNQTITSPASLVRVSAPVIPRRPQAFASSGGYGRFDQERVGAALVTRLGD